MNDAPRPRSPSGRNLRRPPTAATIALAVLVVLVASCGASTSPASTPAAAAEPAPAVSAEAAPVERLAAYLDGLEALGFSGAVLVEHEGEVVLRRGYGLADRESRRPYTPATVQTHGSITKQMTAAAILLLEARGELAVDDPLHEYLPDVPEDKRGITLHHLLTHTSGLPGGIGPDDEPIDAPAYVDRALATPLDFAPGEGFGYSNTGYALLGIVAERVSGRSYEELMREELLLPAGLAETGYLLPAWADERLAYGYLDGELWGRVHRREWLPDGPGWHLRANGGLHTTVDDMHQWLDVVRGRGPLPAAAVARWTTGHVGEDGPDAGPDSPRYGYGWEVATTDAGRLIAHNGGNGIFSADFVWLPDAELFVYVQGNTSVVRAANLREQLLAAWFDPETALPPTVAADPDAAPANATARAGRYRFEDGGTLVLRADDIRLIAGLGGQATFDAAFGHGPEERAGFRRINEKAAEAMRRIEAGREDAFDGLVRPDTDPAARARSLIAAAARGGELQALELIGTIANAPGSRYAEYGPWTTFFRASYPDGDVAVWGLLWRDDGTYRGTAIGPETDLPGFVLNPLGGNTWAALESSPPWRRLPLAFAADGCLELDGRRACPETPEPTER